MQKVQTKDLLNGKRKRDIFFRISPIHLFLRSANLAKISFLAFVHSFIHSVAGMRSTVILQKGQTPGPPELTLQQEDRL